MKRLLSLFVLALAACETETPTHVVIANGYAAPTTVERAWWVTTYAPASIAPQESSEEFRGVPGSDFAYALIAPIGDPTRLVVLKSKTTLAVGRGQTLRITVSDATFIGTCGANQPLTQEDADFITERIFPAEFAGLHYDAATCTTTAIAGSDASAD